MTVQLFFITYNLKKEKWTFRSKIIWCAQTKFKSKGEVSTYDVKENLSSNVSAIPRYLHFDLMDTDGYFRNEKKSQKYTKE